MPNPLPHDGMDDLTARVGRLEVIAADTRADAAAIKATLPHLATREQLAGLDAKLEARTGGLDARIERVDGNIARMEAALVRWVVGSTLAGISAAFTIAKLVH